MCEMFDKVVELSRRLTEWAMTSGIQLAMGRRIAGVTRYHGTLEPENKGEDDTSHQTFLICTGGGPGFMEAANLGAAMVPGSKNIGVRPFLSSLLPSYHMLSRWQFLYHLKKELIVMLLMNWPSNIITSLLVNFG